MTGRLVRICLAVVGVVGAGQIVAAAPAAAPLTEPATVSPGATAVRGVAWDPAAECDLDTARALAGRHPDVDQFVMMLTDTFADTQGTVEVVVRDRGGEWRCQQAPAEARFGRTGTRPLLDRRSGDGTTPAGVFPLGTVTAWDGDEIQFFGNRPDPGVRGAYRAVRHEDCWGATPNAARYQQLVDRPNCTGPDEWLPRYGDVYSHVAIIGANLDPVSGDEPGEPPLAAAIFLHRHSYDGGGATRPTSGCVSLAVEPLVAVLRTIDPARQPHFAIGPVDWLRDDA